MTSLDTRHDAPAPAARSLWFTSARRSVAALCAVAMLSTSLAGCTAGSQEARIGKNDGTDPCYTQRVALDSTGNYFAEDIIKGAAIGAIGGALIGGLTGGSRGALTGAAIGLAAGAAAGYWQAKQQQQADQRTLINSVYADIDRENAQIDKTQQAFNQLVNCRKSTAAQIRSDLQKKLITREVAQMRMDAVKVKFNEDLEIARKISGQIQERSANFQFANEQINPGTAQQTAARRPQAVKPQQVGTAQGVQVIASSNLAKRDQFNNSVASASSGGGFDLGA